jgi:hypothetical protein
MSLVSDIVTNVRYEINDIDNTRYSTDAPILNYIKRAVTRANRIVQREAIQFGKKKTTLTTVASQEYINLPSDFDVDIGLYRPSDYAKIQKCTELEWESIISAEAVNYWYLDLENSRILIKGTPTSAESLTFYYFPKLDVSSYTTASTMPWGGRLDDIIVEYVSLRLKNNDEMDVSIDLQLMTDFEKQIIMAYAPTSVLVTDTAGWI